jgi:fructose-bisphosphate aldolase class I
MHLKYDKKMPWALTFSYSRAVQQPALDAWAGKSESTIAAQQLLYQRLELNSLASRGKYNTGLEHN